MGGRLSSSSGMGCIVQPVKRNHLGKIPKVVALRRWLLLAGSVMIITGMSNLYLKTYLYVNMFIISCTTTDFINIQVKTTYIIITFTNTNTIMYIHLELTFCAKFCLLKKSLIDPCFVLLDKTICFHFTVKCLYRISQASLKSFKSEIRSFF